MFALTRVVLMVVLVRLSVLKVSLSLRQGAHASRAGRRRRAHLRCQDSSPGIDEPVGHLTDAETSLHAQAPLLVLVWVGVRSVLHQPGLESFCDVLGQLASSTRDSRGALAG